MRVLEGLKPERVFKHFEDIAGIPHGSGNTKMISDHLKSFAENHSLRYIQDENNNIIIFKDGSAGRENEPSVILQGHMDMVCEKEADRDINFETDGLSLLLEDGIISADGTTLGGDDGIAVAYCLAILESDTISHPPLEVLITVDEEIGMLGAAALDKSLLSSKRLINIDSEDEGHLLASCAGGETALLHLPFETFASTEGDINTDALIPIKITVDGLIGGHSGMEINKERGNSNKIMGRVLYSLMKDYGIDYYLVSISGGMKDNAIPRATDSVILLKDSSGPADLSDAVNKLNDMLHKEYLHTDPDIRISLNEVKDDEDTSGLIKSGRFINTAGTDKIITAIYTMPNGIQNMSTVLSGLVETSLNMGIIRTLQDEVIITCSLRSSILSRLSELEARITCLTEALGGNVSVQGFYPPWEYKDDSPLRDKMYEVFTSLYGKAPIVESVHAGVECGIFAGSIPDLDAVSFGPDMKCIHTPNESMDSASVKRTWEYLLQVLENI